MDDGVGEIQIFAGARVPEGWLPCDGRILHIDDSYKLLYSLINRIYGSDGITTFALPDLRDRAVVGVGSGVGLKEWKLGQKGGAATTVLTKGNVPPHNHAIQCNSMAESGTLNNPAAAFMGTGPMKGTTDKAVNTRYATVSDGTTMNSTAIAPTGQGRPINNIQPSIAMHYIICFTGSYPAPQMGGTWLEFQTVGEIRIFAGAVAPSGWALCNGAMLPIQENPQLFSVIGTMYGGNGMTMFALPDLRGRVPVCVGQGVGLGKWNVGERRGAETYTLSAEQMSGHNHQLRCNSANGAATSNNPSGMFLATGPGNQLTGAPVNTRFATTSDGTVMNATSLSLTGGTQRVNNIQPSVGVNYIICTAGSYPQRP